MKGVVRGKPPLRLQCNFTNALSAAVNESVSTLQPVLTASKNGGKGRLYTQYMDYTNWNPTLNGYAYNFTVALPGNYNPAQSYPLQLNLHAYNDNLKYPPLAHMGTSAIGR